MDVDRDLPEPIYEQIQTWMRSQIESGAWPEHYKLTAENELAEELGVNRGTLRKAIGGLINEGLLIRAHGKGTFVAPSRLEQPLAESFVTFSEGLITRGIPFTTSVMVAEIRSVSPATASLLGLSRYIQPKAYYLERVRFVRNKPIILLKNHVVHKYAPGIEALDFSEERLFSVLEQRYQLAIDWANRTFEATRAGEEIAAHLGLAEGDPVMYVQQVSYLKDGTAVELSDLWLRGDHFRLSAQVKRDRKESSLRELLVGVDEGA